MRIVLFLKKEYLFLCVKLSLPVCVLSFTPDFTSSWVIRDLTLVTSRGTHFPFTLNVTLPHHMLPLCAQVVPGPSWEETFWMVTLIFTWLVSVFKWQFFFYLAFPPDILRFENYNSLTKNTDTHIKIKSVVWRRLHQGQSIFIILFFYFTISKLISVMSHRCLA